MRLPIYAAAAVVILVVAGFAAFYALGPGPNVGSDPTASPTGQPTLSPATPRTASPTMPAPSSAATPNASPIDTSSWVTYTSDRYGFEIGYPPGWNQFPAQRDWTMSADAANPLSPAHEVFRGPNIRVSAWSVAVDRRTTSETVFGVEAWAQEYCEELYDTPCTGIRERAVPLCVELRDCHPGGLLVPFEEDVQAFFTGGIYGEKMVVVAVWWEESAPAVALYGGSQRLLEAFLSTMDVSPRR